MVKSVHKQHYFDAYTHYDKTLYDKCEISFNYNNVFTSS